MNLWELEIKKRKEMIFNTIDDIFNALDDGSIQNAGDRLDNLVELLSDLFSKITKKESD